MNAASRDPEPFRGDVAVVGAGPLGIVTALECADAGMRVVLIESGYGRPDAAVQKLSDLDPSNDDYFHDVGEASIRRQIGGTTALWGGRCVPFDPIDFEPRPWQPADLWPIRYADVAAYYEAACDWVKCGRPVFNAAQLSGPDKRALVPGLRDGDVRATDLERWSLPTRFGALYADRLRQHPRIELVQGLTCVRVEHDPNGTSVSRLVLKGLAGEHRDVVADRYVLAAGGLESTRLLMVSKSEAFPDGIGNGSGHLGRWYMSHVEGRVAEVVFHTDPTETICEHERDVDGSYVRRRFTVSYDAQMQDAIPNAAVWLVNPDLPDHRHGSGILSGVYLTLTSPVGKYMLADAIRRAHTTPHRPTSVWAHLKNILFDLGPSLKFAVTFTYKRFLRRGRKVPGFFVRSQDNVYPLHYHGEHLPSFESRVELSDTLDELGVPRLRTHTVFSARDFEGVRLVLDRIDRHLKALGVGEIRYLGDDVSRGVHTYLEAQAGFHQTGLTRMSADPGSGVVDRDLRVHGLDNLYVCSTSTFPTSGQANPTFMGIAFAVRLAHHLRDGQRTPPEAAARASNGAS